MHIRLLCLTACVLACAGSFAKERPIMTTAPTLVIEHRDSPWLEYTGSFEEEQAGYRLTAAERLDGMEVPPHLKNDLYQTQPLLAIDRARRKVFINGTVFGDLSRPDATRLNPGESAVVGILRRPEAFSGMAALAEFLLRAQIVRTYAHVRAELNKTAEQDSPMQYRAAFQGTHEYFTNKRHVKQFHFAIIVERSSGEIRIEGIPAQQTH